MKKIMAILALCALSSLVAMDIFRVCPPPSPTIKQEADYLSPAYNKAEWTLIEKRRESMLPADKTPPDWEALLDVSVARGYSSRNACTFNRHLYDLLDDLLRVQIKTLIKNDAPSTDIIPLVQQGEGNIITTALSCAACHNTTVLKALLTTINPPLAIFKWAAENRNLMALKIALERGIDINTRVDINDQTALMYWSEDLYAHNIAQLIEWGANLNSKDWSPGKTALMRAIKLERFAHASALLSYGANPHIVDKNKQTAMHYAHATGNPEFIKLIQHSIQQYKCLCCAKYQNNNLNLLPCPSKHLGNFICPDCLATVQAKDNSCPLCSNQLS
jgi:hypothetical protein